MRSLLFIVPHNCLQENKSLLPTVSVRVYVGCEAIHRGQSTSPVSSAKQTENLHLWVPCGGRKKRCLLYCFTRGRELGADYQTRKLWFLPSPLIGSCFYCQCHVILGVCHVPTCARHLISVLVSGWVTARHVVLTLYPYWSAAGSLGESTSNPVSKPH